MIKNKKIICFRIKKALQSSKYKFSFHKIIIIIFLLILFKSEDKSKKQIEIFNIKQFFNTTIKSNSILIFEKNSYHYECTPGFTKYFLDLGFNVDIIMTIKGKEIFTFFMPNENIRLFILDDSKYYKSIEYIEQLRIIFNKYLAILVQTMNLDVNYFCKESNLLNGKHSIFVYHYHPQMGLIDFHNKIPLC